MEATATGADVSFEQIAALNFPLYPNDLVVAEGCTNLAFGSGPDGPLWGKNNDGNDPRSQLPPCCRIVRPASGIPQAVFTFCGMVATTDGMNAEGVAVGHSSVGSVFQQSDRFVPIRLWAYNAMMHARCTVEFLDLMARVPLRGKGYAIVCVDRAGAACSIEAPCPLLQVRLPRESTGHVNCTNYYQLPQLSDADRRTPEGKANAAARRHLLDQLFAGTGDTSIGGMVDILRRHRTADEPGICRHSGEDQGVTEYSMIGVPQAGQVLYYHGRPCGGEYSTLSL